MSGWNDFLSKAGQLAKSAAAATRQAADSAKLSINIAQEEDKLKTAYTTLGWLFMEALDSGDLVSNPALDQKIAEVRELRQRIAQYRQQKESAKDAEPDSPPSSSGTEDHNFTSDSAQYK